MRYNIHAPASHFRIGTKVRVVSCVGSFSNKTGIVIEHFNWREENGSYSPPGGDEIPIQYDNKKKGYMFKDHLIHI